jgi:glutamate synthase domain-containing protein 2/glutamate synthase domain-containing protein 1/glutamate synthase domain-containing protein 3
MPPLNTDLPDQRYPLYDPRWEHDACGVGFVAQTSGRKSHDIVRMAVRSVCNLTHRGAVGADTQTGDGAGILTQIPARFLLESDPRLAAKIRHEDELGVGMMFMPRDPEAFALCKALVEHVLWQRDLTLLGWRTVPTDHSVIGDAAALTAPDVRQVLVKRAHGMMAETFERRLYLARKHIERHAWKANMSGFYICSFSSRTIVYKGLMIATALDRFFPDLKDPLYESALAIYHQRYSTNTFPTWGLAQPFRMVAHNGEINTIQGNRVWTSAREAELSSEVWGDDIRFFQPLIQPGGSDSANLDNALEALTLSGRKIQHALLMLVPEAWSGKADLNPKVKDFFEYHECFSEPWDGPAALVFSDGETVAASLDRNGLRPARYAVTGDGLVILGSEVGALELDESRIVEKGKLGPGQMIAVDTARGRVLKDLEIKQELSRRRPYSTWVGENLYRLRDHVSPPANRVASLSGETLVRHQIAFGYSAEELPLLLKPMAEQETEPVGSMGDDAPLAALSKFAKILPSYFKQQFAQVTNPPIDPIRERMVMSLTSNLGYRRNWFGETPEHAKQVKLESPLLLPEEIEALRCIQEPAFRHATISLLFPKSDGEAGFERALASIAEQAAAAADDNAHLLILSDRGMDESHAPLPVLLAVGAVHSHLLQTGRRLRVSVIAETAEPRDVHHFATLIGYGANAVHPYLAIDTIIGMTGKEITGITPEEAVLHFKRTIEKGILKVMSKMGISMLGSYRGAQIFEAVGISQAVVDRFFPGTPTRMGGLLLRDIARETLDRHSAACTASPPSLNDEGIFRFRKNGERHAWSPDALRAMQKLRTSADSAEYERLVQALQQTTPVGVKDLLEFRRVNAPVPLDEVEPVENIRKRFTTAAMSLGSLSPEVHETIAIAMNRIGGKSNTGEGGEDPARFAVRPNGDSANSAIKQVASARFGVTAEYLANARELEIKMAQGSKPGEGGQIPASKVSPLIAHLRKSVPGISLISPPPHHDIYSIEDLAQLIYDLKQVNPRAKICVKLVSEAGVGTIAAGVAKAYADVVLISGHEGGTGASPLSSVKNAGGPWELGLAEAQQVLVRNGLRERVTVRVDGGLKTGRDIVIAAMLGAEEFNFGTAALISLGCRYVRQCHLNTCPVGIATQNEQLRKRFEGKPEHLIAYLNAVAQDIRSILASLGFRSLDEVVGRTDYLQQRSIPDHPKANTLDLSSILVRRDYESEQRYRVWHRNDKPDTPLDDTILLDVKEAIGRHTPVIKSYAVRNVHRSIGAKLSGEIAYLYGQRGLPPGTIELRLTGSAGQSLGAFLVRGVRILLEGEANDYVGKGLSGGEIVVVPSPARLQAPSDIIAGNTVLYGATEGSLFLRGRAGERFAVRNSGATAVCEGAGDHACEYMTGGTVLILGTAGRNFGAGMTGGIAFVYDPTHELEQRTNTEYVRLVRVEEEEDLRLLRTLLHRHNDLTASPRARTILTDWEDEQALFWKAVPRSGPAKTTTGMQPTPAENPTSAFLDRPGNAFIQKE